jgi:hypothetical protein
VAVLLSAIEGEDTCQPGRCAYKPWAKPRSMAAETPALAFAADLNVLLAYYKLKDDWLDERKLLAMPALAALRPAAKRAEDANPALSQAIANGIAGLRELEKQNCAELDAPADAFAQMMRRVGACAPITLARNLQVFEHLLYHVGRWVYLMDAWDDLHKDKKSGAYNPFIASNASRERAEFLLHCSRNEAIAAYELLDIGAHRGITDNVLYEGCAMKMHAILGGRDEQSI